MISAAHRQQGQLNISTSVILPWFPPPLFSVFPAPPRGSVLFSFKLGFFGSAMFPPSVVFDLAPFESEAGAPPCLCVCVPTGSGGCLDIGAKLGEKISQEAPLPRPFLHPAETEREKESQRIPHKSFYWGNTGPNTPNTHTHPGGKFCLPCYHFIPGLGWT